MNALPHINHERDGEQLVFDLCRVPDEAALVVARFFEDSAAKLRERHKVWQHRQAVRRESERHRASLTRLPGRVLDQMAGGRSYEEAAALVADAQGIPRHTVHAHFIKMVREVEARARIEIGNKAVAMAYEGCSDEQISEETGLTPRQVSIIIRDHKAKG